MTEAEILALKYNLNPIEGGIVWEFGNLSGAFKTTRLGNTFDKTNCLVQYNPELDSNLPFLATGTLTPDATGEYVSLGGYWFFATYWNEEKGFHLWYRGAGNWTISETIGDISGPYWNRHSNIIDGDYTNENGAVGTLTLSAQYPETHNVTGTLTPDATCNYHEAGVHNGRPYFEREDSAYFLWWAGFWWTLTNGLGVHNSEWRSIPWIVRPCREYQAMADTEGQASIAMGEH